MSYLNWLIWFIQQTDNAQRDICQSIFWVSVFVLLIVLTNTESDSLAFSYSCLMLCPLKYGTTSKSFVIWGKEVNGLSWLLKQEIIFSFWQMAENLEIGALIGNTPSSSFIKCIYTRPKTLIMSSLTYSHSLVSHHLQLLPITTNAPKGCCT